MPMQQTPLPRSATGVRWDGLALAVDGPDRPSLRVDVADGRRLVLFQGEQVVLLARQRATLRGVHYVRTGRYDSPLPPLRADAARARRETHPDDTDAWFAGWAQHFASGLHSSLNGPLHGGNWQLTPGLPRQWDIAANWARLPHHDPPIGHITWFGYGDPVEDARDILPLRPLSAPDAARVKAYRRQYREGVLPPVLLWWVGGLDTFLVLDGHDRLAAALAENGRPAVLALARELPDQWATRYAQPLISEYEHRAAQLADAGAEGDPLAALRARAASGRLGQQLHELVTARAPTWSWPLPGGAAAWDELARRHAPGWRPDTEN
ncbi:hypothetical protein ACTPOK_07505 [Streptomyces inhibens]|uniref:hypothetical protein n=1 Tax=Streptomyces inhibens TaxID=2293571 RepID=UPI00402AAD6C